MKNKKNNQGEKIEFHRGQPDPVIPKNTNDRGLNEDEQNQRTNVEKDDRGVNEVNEKEIETKKKTKKGSKEKNLR